VEIMSVPSQSNGRLVWQELLSPEEIVRWIKNREKPNKPQLQGCISHPGVYRFIFPTATDGRSSHTPCYIGEAGDLGDRLPVYFRAPFDKEKRDEEDNLIINSEWKVQGAIQNAIRDSMGNCSLQLLTIDGLVTFCGVTFNLNDLDKMAVRRLLENWGILHSINEGFYPLNYDIHQGTRNFLRLKEDAAEKAVRLGMDRETGWPEVH
jgi:hypothetical protein